MNRLILICGTLCGGLSLTGCVVSRGDHDSKAPVGQVAKVEEIKDSGRSWMDWWHREPEVKEFEEPVQVKKKEKVGHRPTDPYRGEYGHPRANHEWHEESAGVGLMLQALAMSASADGMIAAWPAFMATPTGDLDPTEVIKPSIEMHMGARVGLCIDSDRDDWEITFTYMYFGGNSPINSYAQHPDAGDIIPRYIFDPTTDLHLVYHADTQWNLVMNVVDAAVGLNFDVGLFQSLKPEVGIKGAWHTSTNSVNYKYNTSGRDLEMVVFGERYSGVGPKVGCSTCYYCTKNISLLGGFQTSTLWTQNKTNISYKNMNSSEQVEYTAVSTLEQLFTVRPVMEALFALKFEADRDKSPYHISMQMGWELQHWFDFITYSRFTSTTHQVGALSVQGANLAVRIDY